MRLQSYSLLAFLAVAVPAASARAQARTPYDVFVYNAFAMTSTEVNGTLAVGGAATLTLIRRIRAASVQRVSR